jgi:hypothetical protein
MIIRKYNQKYIIKFISIWYELNIISHSFLGNDILKKSKKRYW